MSLLALPVALAFAAVHVLSPRLVFLDTVPRSRWLSFGGGVSVAYVFLHILPELAKQQAELATGARLMRAEVEIFLVALVGLVLFYGLERIVTSSSLQHKKDRHGERRTSPRIFWLHIGSFAIYNGLIGYLLVHREEMDLKGLVLYAIALGLHFVVNDRGLQEHHGGLYEAYGRWIVAAAVLAGWALGMMTAVDPAWLAVLFAFLAGGITLNVLKEELPEERESRFPAFVTGVAAYAALLLAL